jgi:hypothetical protein
MSKSSSLRGKRRAQDDTQRRRSRTSPRPSSGKAKTTGRQVSQKGRHPSPTRRSHRMKEAVLRTPVRKLKHSEPENSAACLTPLQDLPRSLSPGNLDESSEYYQQDLSLHKLKLKINYKYKKALKELKDSTWDSPETIPSTPEVTPVKPVCKELPQQLPKGYRIPKLKLPRPTEIVTPLPTKLPASAPSGSKPKPFPKAIPDAQPRKKIRLDFTPTRQDLDERIRGIHESGHEWKIRKHHQ